MRRAWHGLLTFVVVLAGLGIHPAWAQAIADEEILPARVEAKPEEKVASPAAAAKPPSANYGDFQVAFVKPAALLPPGVMFFNVLKIQNQATTDLKVQSAFSIPPRCKLILQPQDEGELLLEAGKPRFIPVRVSFPSDAQGGIPYPITLTLSDENGKPWGEPLVIEVFFEQVSKWQITSPITKTYSSSSSENYTPVPFLVRNFGNTLEELRMEFAIGSSLAMEEAAGRAYTCIVPVRPSSDTTFEVHVRVTESGEEAMQGDNNRLKLVAHSSTDTTKKDVMVIFEGIDDSYRNEMDESESPLVLSLNQVDVGSISTTTQVNLSGNILLKGDRKISYNYEFQDAFLDPNNNRNTTDVFWRTSRMHLSYETGGKQFRIGDVSGGRGFSFREQTKTGSSSLYIGRGVNSADWSAGGNMQRSLSDDFRIKGGIQYQRSASTNEQVLTPSIGANLAINKYHSLSFKTTLTRLSTFGRGVKPIKETGIGYDLQYSGDIKGIKIGLKNQYGSKNYLAGTAGAFQLEGSASYAFANRSSLKVMYRHGRFETDKEGKEGEVMLTNFQKRSSLSVNYQTMAGNLPLAMGVGWSSSDASQEVFTDGSENHFNKDGLNMGIATQFKGKNNKELSLSPSVNVGMSRAKDSSLPENMAQSPVFFAKVGMRARHGRGSLSLDYDYSASAGVDAALRTSEKTSYQQRLKLASSTELIAKERFNLSLDAGAEYQVESQELETHMGASLSVETQNGWTFTLKANGDPSKMAQGKGGGPKIQVGAHKAFDMNQPRLKYYTLQLVFFKDLDGDREKGNADPGISNILVEAERMKEQLVEAEQGGKIKFQPPGIMSDENGEVVFFRVPEGSYLVELEELFSPMQFTNLLGSTLELSMNQHKTLFVPYTKSVTFTGKVEITRDKFSRLNGVSASRIRVAVTDAQGNPYYVLTNGQGKYILNVPYSESYVVSMKNVLGTKFELIGAEQPIEVSEDNLRYEVNFHYKEKGRSVNFGK